MFWVEFGKQVGWAVNKDLGCGVLLNASLRRQFDSGQNVSRFMPVLAAKCDGEPLPINGDGISKTAQANKPVALDAIGLRFAHIVRAGMA